MGQAQVGLKKYDEAEATYKKALELETASKKPNPAVQGLANSGLGEIYARTGKVPEANAAYDAAAKVNPPQAGFYLKNEAVIFFQINNADAQVAAADKAIARRSHPAAALLPQGPGTDRQVHHRSQDADRIVLPPDAWRPTRSTCNWPRPAPMPLR